MAPDIDSGEYLFEELEFNSQIPQGDLDELEYLQAGGYKDDYGE